MDEIIAWLWMLDFWHWWAIGIALVALETFVVSTFLLWPGLSAFAMGFIVLVFPDMDWRFQIILFAIMAVITSVGWQIWLRKNPTKSDHPNLNVRGASFIGRRVTLAEPLTNGRGRIEIGDGWWTASRSAMAGGPPRVRMVKAWPPASTSRSSTATAGRSPSSQFREHQASQN